MVLQLSHANPLSPDRRSLLRAATWAFILLLSCTLHAQQTAAASQFDHFAEQQTTTSLKALSSNSQAVIDRLSQLSLPSFDRWRYLLGEVENGQSVSLDDSSWSFVDRSSRHTTSAVWLRQWIKIPKNLNGYDLTGAHIWLRLAIRAWGSENGVTLYVNGRQVAQTDGVEPIVLLDFIQPGEKALLAVKIGSTTDQKYLAPPELHLQAAANRLDPGDLYTEIVDAAVLLPSLKDSAAIKTGLEKSIADVDLKALDACDQQKFDASLNRSQQDLELVKPMLQQVTLHVTGNSHMDTAWMWPWSETVDAVKRTFSTALQLMDDHPAYTYSQSVAQYYEWMAEKYPAMNAEIKRRIRDGHWEIIGGMWAEPDLNMPDGESLVRQLLIGQRTFQQLYGVTTRIGWNPDSFGYNWQLPQIYKKSGLDYFVTQKLSANETNPLPMKLFWWESPDGSKVLTYFPHSYGNSNLSPIRLSNDLVKARTLALQLPEIMDLYGVGDHGGGPTRAVLDEGLHWMEPDKVVPKMEFGNAQSYFSVIEKKIAPDSPTWNYHLMGRGVEPLPAPADGQVSIPTWKDELYFEHHRGTYTTQAQQKRNGRESEEWMLNAEKYSSLAWLDGQTYPATELNEAWEKVLINQSHDLSAGSGIGVIYKEAQRDYNQVHWATDEISSNALHVLQARIDTRVDGGVPVLVFNPLGWDRSGTVEVEVQMPVAAAGGVSVLDARNHILPSKIVSADAQTNTYKVMLETGTVPSLGYKVLHVLAGRRSFASDLRINGMTMENANLSVTVDPQTGCITSIYDKKAKHEALAAGACGDQLQTFKDTPQNDDAWNIDPGTLDHFTPLMQADSIRVVENGPLRGVIRVTRTWQSSKFVQDIVLAAGSDQIDIVNDIDWHESHVLLKAAFPLAASSPMATYEIPYGTIDRPTTRTNSWDEAKFEVPALRWADLGDSQNGFSLLNEAKYGYDCNANVLRLTLLRSPGFPDPVADRGHHHFTFALYPHSGNWKSALTIRHGYEYNYRLSAMQVQAHTGALPKEHSFVQLEATNVVLTALKKAEDSDSLVLRFYEWAGKDSDVSLHVPAGATSATLTNLMEKPEGTVLPVTGSGEVTVPTHPYSIETLRVDYPHERKDN